MATGFSSTPGADWDPDRDVGWELYDLHTDFSQAKDIAAEHPDKVQERQRAVRRHQITTLDIEIPAEQPASHLQPAYRRWLGADGKTT